MIQYMLLFIVVSRVVLTSLALYWQIQVEQITSLRTVLSRIPEVWASADSGWYIYTAINGYMSTPFVDGPVATQANYAFFPLYPVLMRLLGDVIGGNYLLAGFLISNIALVIGVIFFYRFLATEETPEDTRFILQYVLMFPSAFLYSAVLTEGLFFMLMGMSLYFARKQQWLLASVCGFFLALTRSLGILIIIPVFWEYLTARQILVFNEVRPRLNLRGVDIRLLTFVLIPAGFLVFMLYIYQLTGDLFAIVNIQEAWGREQVNPISALVEIASTRYPMDVFLVGFTVMFIGILAVSFRQLKFSYWIFGLLMAIVPLLNTTHGALLASVPRYYLVIFPFFIILGRYMATHPRLDEFVKISFLLCQSVFMISWLSGHVFLI